MRQTFHLPASTTRITIVERLTHVLSNLPLGKSWDLELKEHKAKRSDPQNRYLWGVVYPTILQAGGNALGGWTADDLHEYLLGEHFGWEILEGFGKRRQRPIRRSSRLNKMEFMDFIAFIQQRMAGHGIYVPDPNEYEHYGRAA